MTPELLQDGLRAVEASRNNVRALAATTTGAAVVIAQHHHFSIRRLLGSLLLVAAAALGRRALQLLPQDAPVRVYVEGRGTLPISWRDVPALARARQSEAEPSP